MKGNTSHKRNYSISMFRCPDCGHKMYVTRNKANPRENNHIKDLWCWHCKTVKKMMEVKDFI